MVDFSTFFPPPFGGLMKGCADCLTGGAILATHGAANAGKEFERAFDEGCKNLFVSCFSASFENAKRFSSAMESLQRSPFLIPRHVDDHKALAE